jgi:hypothetical protein
MARGDRPAGRLKYKARDGKRYDVGTMWRGERGGWQIQPEKRDDFDAQYPKMRLSEAAKRVEAGDGFLDVWEPQDRQQSGGGDFD